MTCERRPDDVTANASEHASPGGSSIRDLIRVILLKSQIKEKKRERYDPSLKLALQNLWMDNITLRKLNRMCDEDSEADEKVDDGMMMDLSVL